MMTFLINPFMFGGKIIFQVKTDNAGTSNSTSFTLPLRSASVYNYTIEWGDGVVESFANATNRTHDYGIAGTYTVRITGTFAGNFYFNNAGDKAKIIKVTTHTLAFGQRLENTFHGCSNLTELNVAKWDTSKVVEASRFAAGCSSLTSLDVSNWDTSNFTNLALFIQSCSSLQNLNVSNWNTAKVVGFASFAQGCTNLQALDVSNWNTSSAVSTAFGGFALGCSNITSLDISNWNTANVTSFGSFARDCTKLTTLTVGNAFNNSPCTNYSFAFSNCNLNQASVDAILVSINAANTSSGTLNINGGTNATPSATGQAATDALRARGWTVTLNGY